VPLSKSSPVLLENAEIHYHEESSPHGRFGSFVIDNFLLHPDRGNFQLNCLIDNLSNELRAAKDVYDVDLLGNFQQRRV